jgi:hypothetical protein
MNHFNYKLNIQVNSSNENVDTQKLKDLFIIQINRRNCSYEKITLMWYYNVNDYCYYLDTITNNDADDTPSNSAIIKIL